MLDVVNKNKVFTMWRDIWSSLTPRRRQQAVRLLVLAVIASGAEIISIGALVPFLGILIAPERVMDIQEVRHLVVALGIVQQSNFILFITVVFLFAVFAAAALRVFVSWFSIRFAVQVGGDWAAKVLQNVLCQSYSQYINSHSGDVVDTILTKLEKAVFLVLVPLIQAIASAIVFACISISIIILQPVLSIILVSVVGVIYASIHTVTKSAQVRQSHIANQESVKRVKLVQEALGAFRDVTLSGLQDQYLSDFRRLDSRMRSAQVRASLTSVLPRYFIEAIGMCTLVLIAYYMISTRVNVFIIPILGGLALAAQRILPLAQQIYYSASNISGNRAYLEAIFPSLLKDNLKIINNNEDIKFHNGISFCHVGFKYPGSEIYILNDINFELRRGEKLAIVGATGSGKSTFVDMIMGLLSPTIGEVRVDNVLLNDSIVRAWQSKIAHVPQVMYFVDGCVAENIAFGVAEEDIDWERLKESVRLAELESTINNWADGYNTRVGERGIRLSGGQCQRIAIARALYKNADLIVLDEATSALDAKTERAIINNLGSIRSSATILMITHRESLLALADRVIRIENGRLRAEPV